MNIFIVRHAISEANTNQLFSGRRDVPLAKEGIIQAQKLCDYFTANYSADKVFYSGLSRTRDTVLPICKKLNLTPEVMRDFVEIDVGEWEGVKYNEVKERYPEEMKVWRENIGAVNCPGGESMAKVYERACSGLLKICESEKDGANILIATHGGVIRCLRAFACGVPLDKMYTVDWVNNASLSLITYENGRINPVFFGTDDYLI